MHPLLPRPALFLLGHVASSLYLLDHAIWASSTSQPGCNADIEVFRRWVIEGGLDSALANVQRAKAVPQERMQMDAEIVFGFAGEKSIAKL